MKHRRPLTLPMPYERMYPSSARKSVHQLRFGKMRLVLVMARACIVFITGWMLVRLSLSQEGLDEGDGSAERLLRMRDEAVAGVRLIAELSL